MCYHYALLGNRSCADGWALNDLIGSAICVWCRRGCVDGKGAWRCCEQSNSFFITILLNTVGLCVWSDRPNFSAHHSVVVSHDLGENR